jgi:hypothetical protein
MIETQKQENRASFILGILSLSLGWIFTWIGSVLAIIGLCLPKTKGHEIRDIIINIIGIWEGIISIFIWIAIISYLP